MWEAIVCPQGEYEERHKCNYLLGDCPSCGVHKFVEDYDLDAT